MNSSRISTKLLLQYGSIALPMAFAGFPLYVLAPDFYATHHSLSLTLLGELLLAIRLGDAVIDPLIGWLTDELQGRLLPAVVIAGAVVCLSIAGLFNVIFISPTIWFTFCTFFAVGAYSVLTIALGAQATLWTNNKNDQTRIAGMREAIGLIGLIIAVTMPVILSHIVTLNHIYLWYAVILALFMIVGVFSFSQASLHIPRPKNLRQKRKVSIMLALQALPKESARLFIIYGLSMLASSIPAVLVIFYVRDLLGVEDLTGFFLLLYFLSGAIAMPFWKKLSIRHGKYKAWYISNILAVTGFIGAFFLNSGDVWPYAFVCVISGLALGADLTLPPSILADDVHAHGNGNFSGTHYAFLSFIAKASLALASAIALPALDVGGFKPQAINTHGALMVLSAAYALIPCLLKLASAGLLYFFFIRPRSGGTHETVRNLHDYRSDLRA